MGWVSYAHGNAGSQSSELSVAVAAQWASFLADDWDLAGFYKNMEKISSCKITIYRLLGITCYLELKLYHPPSIVLPEAI